MSETGRMEVVNVVGMEFVDNGRSLRLEIVASIPPYATSYVTFRNTYGIKLFTNGKMGRSQNKVTAVATHGVGDRRDRFEP